MSLATPFVACHARGPFLYPRVLVIPTTGDMVLVRSRQHLVEGLDIPPQRGDSTIVRLSFLEDDSQGDPLEVLWDREVDAHGDKGCWTLREGLS